MLKESQRNKGNMSHHHHHDHGSGGGGCGCGHEHDDVDPDGMSLYSLIDKDKASGI